MIRVFVSNTAHDQAWQKEASAAASNSTGAAVPGTDGVDMDSGSGIAGWVLRIEGRLLDVSIHSWADH